MTSTAAAERKRLLWGYEAHTPRCSNCVGWKPARLKPGAPPSEAIQRPRCRKGGFEIEAHGCCDKWSDRNGERLRAEGKAP